MKSFVAKDGGKAKVTDNDPSNPTVDFHGEKRSNKTHASTTDPDARLMRKSSGQESRLAFSYNILMENRNGLCVDMELLHGSGTAEREAALAMLERRRKEKKIVPKTLGGDKGYHARELGRRFNETD
ncbi:MAG: hypothetical protein HY280_09850 [Nitrospinae bacterium]|nr:hypothetical protein [Nitrospinota bacterium]